MNSYIALIRSINVSGTNIIKMAELRPFWEQMGFTNVRTYIQSGNVIFESNTKPDTALIEAQIEKEFGTKNAAVILLTPKELTAIINENPFSKQTDFDKKKMYVCYLQTPPTQDQIAAFDTLNLGEDKVHFGNNVLYVYYGVSAGKSKLTNKVIEKHLNAYATARNWNTTNKLLELAK